jgi:transcriptional regulator with XRE-family HTH domain
VADEEIDAEIDADKVIGENIQKFRKAKGLSQAQLAEALSEWAGQPVAQQTVLKIEKGTRPLRFAEAQWFAFVLGVPISALSEGSDIGSLAARRLKSVDAVENLGEELTDVGRRLGYALLEVALGVSLDREFKPESEALQYMTRLGETLLIRDWGAVLNSQIMQSLQGQPYLAQIKPKFKADNYTEVLKKVTETPVRNWNEGSDDATP